jgi:hypothetical protein
MRSGLTIEKLAGVAGVNVETIRYYQRRCGSTQQARMPIPENSQPTSWP